MSPWGKTPGHQQGWRRGLRFPGLPRSQSWAHCGPAGKRSCDSGHLVPPQPVEATDDAFWDQFWADTATSVQDVFALVPAAEIRAVREESPSNLATLCYKVRGPSPSLSPLPEPFSTIPGRLELAQPCGPTGPAPRTSPPSRGDPKASPASPPGWALGGHLLQVSSSSSPCVVGGLPWWLSDTESTNQCRRQCNLTF